ncbi:hypothetical protein GJV44_00888 [Candidatus Vallotia cooleyia]|nr:hypothetical protein GJV44_00888 [Candidatus Vallotia cooleyia]
MPDLSSSALIRLYVQYMAGIERDAVLASCTAIEDGGE